MPVKDSLETAEQAIRAIVASDHTLTVYDDYSTEENAARLDALHEELGIAVVHIREHVDHPSPNYRWVLNEAQKACIANANHLVIVESDVIVRQDTIETYYRYGSGGNRKRARRSEFPVRTCQACESGRAMQEAFLVLLHTADEQLLKGV